MNARQDAAIRLLRADPRREIYESAARNDPQRGSGEFWVTYSADEKYWPLNRTDIDGLLKAGLIHRTWEDFDGWFSLVRKESE